MGISRFDTLTPYESHPLDWRFAGELAERGQQRKDKSLEKLGETEGLLATLNPAPGHEAYAQEVSARYKDALPQVYDKLNRGDTQGAIQDTFRLKAAFANDPDVKRIVNSREAYDKKWSTIMNDPKNKGAIYDMPGILGPNDEFLPNRNSYDNLNYTPPTSYLDDINNYYSKLPTQSKGWSDSGKVVTDEQGNKIFVQNEGTHEFRNATEAAPKLAMQLTDPGDPNYTYMKKKWEKVHGPGTYTAQNITPWLETVAQPWNIDKRTPNIKAQFIREAAESSKKPVDPEAIPRVVTNPPNRKAEENTSWMNILGDKSIEVPRKLTSKAIEQPLGNKGNYTFGKYNYYALGDELGSGTSEYGRPTNSIRSIKDATVTGYDVMYEILPNNNPVSKDQQYSYEDAKPGALVTYGKYSSVGVHDKNYGQPQFDEKTGKYYVLSGDKKKEKIWVQPIATRVIQGTSEKDGTNLPVSFIEKIPRRESLKYFDGQNFSNQDYFEPTQTGIKANITEDEQARLLGRYFKDGKIESNPGVAKLMVAFGEIIKKSPHDWTPEEQSIFSTYSELLQKAETKEAQQELILPKDSYTPQGAMGQETH